MFNPIHLAHDKEFLFCMKKSIKMTFNLYNKAIQKFIENIFLPDYLWVFSVIVIYFYFIKLSYKQEETSYVKISCRKKQTVQFFKVQSKVYRNERWGGQSYHHTHKYKGRSIDRLIYIFQCVLNELLLTFLLLLQFATQYTLLTDLAFV